MEQHWDGEHGRHEDHQCERHRRRLEQRRLGRLLGRLRLLSSLGSAAPRPLRLGLLAGATEKRYRARAVRCAAPFCDLMRPFAIAVRSGLHIDEIELKRDDVAGMAVHIAARVAVEAKVGETVVSTSCAIWSRALGCALRTAASIRCVACPTGAPLRGSGWLTRAAGGSGPNFRLRGHGHAPSKTSDQ